MYKIWLVVAPHFPSHPLDFQGPAQLDIHCKGQAFMLRRLSSNSAGVMASIVGEVLETCESNGVLSLAQRQAIIAELAARLGPML
jgi:hypothetical protein